MLRKSGKELCDHVAAGFDLAWPRGSARYRQLPPEIPCESDRINLEVMPLQDRSVAFSPDGSWWRPAPAMLQSWSTQRVVRNSRDILGKSRDILGKIVMPQNESRTGGPLRMGIAHPMTQSSSE
jgi:hypothetical protein